MGLTLRKNLNRPLTSTEVDGNFTYLNIDRWQQKGYSKGQIVYHTENISGNNILYTCLVDHDSSVYVDGFVTEGIVNGEYQTIWIQIGGSGEGNIVDITTVTGCTPSGVGISAPVFAGVTGTTYGFRSIKSLNTTTQITYDDCTIYLNTDSGTSGTSGTSSNGTNGTSGTSSNGTNGTSGISVNGTNGTSGTSGLTGRDGQSTSLFLYKSETTGTTTPPSIKRVRWNNVTQTSATQLYISKFDDNGIDISLFLGLIQNGQNILIQNRTDSTQFQRFTVNGTPTATATAYTVPVTFQSSGGVAFSNLQDIFIGVYAFSGTSGTSGISVNGTNGTSGISVNGTNGTSSNGTNGTSGTSSNGTNGTSGTSSNGTNGTSGTSGISVNGTNGTSGISSNGTNGTSGTSGTSSNGTNGTSGISVNGTNGTSGISSNGTNGTSGTNGLGVTGAAFGITIDGLGDTISTGSKGYVRVPYNCTIIKWSMAADVTSSIVIDVKRSGTSIVGVSGNKPTLTSAQFALVNVSSWTSTTVTADDLIEFNVDSATTISRLNLSIIVQRT